MMEGFLLARIAGTLHNRSRRNHNPVRLPETAIRRIDMRVSTPGIPALCLALAAFWMPPREADAQDKPPAKAEEPKQVQAPYTTDHAKPLEAKEEVVNEADDHTQLRV